MPRDTTELIELDSLPKFDGTTSVNEFSRVIQTKVRLQTTNMDFIGRLASYFIENVTEGLLKFIDEWNPLFMKGLCVESHPLIQKEFVPRGAEVKTGDVFMIFCGNKTLIF